ncbi:MAG TPA: glycosyltransferase family A protein [Solirubrobacteraceae bacterium]|nr:glycosyltransferase family A protein [Solirubrobacteraceae bacterium]
MLSVVVPATDAPPTLGRCLAALERCGDAHELEVVTSAPGSGPAAARNAGVASTRGEIVVFVDADVEVHPDALGRLRAALDRDAGLDAVFGAYDEQPAARATVSRFRNLLHHHVHCGAAGPATTFWAGLGAIRRDAFLAVGGFDAARYPRPSIEDIELGMRLHAAGRRIALDPAARGTHLKRWTLRSMLRTDLAARGAPWVALRLERGGPGSAALNLAWRHRRAAAAAALAAAGAAAGRGRLAALALAAMVAPNARFYALLARCGGPRLALAGVPLHLLHHLTAVASVPGGALLWLRAGRGR